MEVKSKQMQAASEKMFFFSVRELSVHGTSCQPVEALPPSTLLRNDWTKDVEL